MDLSIIIPTHRRAAKAAACVAALAGQDYEGCYEVLVGVDGPEDSSSTAHAVSEAWERARCGSQRSAGAEQTKATIHVFAYDKQGQASVRNRLLEHARGRTLVFLNDDMIPEPGFLRAHAQAQEACRAAGQPALIVGDSPWRVHKPDRLFDRLVRETSMVFFYDQMRRSQDPQHDWGFRHAWLLNLSTPADLVRAVDGFTVFPSTYGYEDDELAFRLRERFETRVLYRPEAIAVHDHRMEPRDYLDREYKLGFAAWGFARVAPVCAQEMFRRDVTSDDEIAYSRAFVEREERLATRLERTFLSLADHDADALEPKSPLVNTVYEQHLLLKRWHWRRGLVDASVHAMQESR
jgi:GT2 family glycosyltransferase